MKIRAILLLITLSVCNPALALWKGERLTLNSSLWRSVVQIEYGVLKPCIGTFVSETEIVTAAHCLDSDVIWGQSSGKRQVKITFFKGSQENFDVGTVEKIENKRHRSYGDYFYSEQSYDVESVTIPQQFVVYQRFADIGVIRLKKPAFPSSEYRPLKPLTSEVIGSNARIHDLKTLVVGMHHGPRILHSLASLPVGIDYLHESNTYVAATVITSGMSLVCKGDSGGPLIAQHNGEYYLMGVVSGVAAKAHQLILKAPHLVDWDPDDGVPVTFVCAKTVEYTLLSREFRRLFMLD